MVDRFQIDTLNLLFKMVLKIIFKLKVVFLPLYSAANISEEKKRYLKYQFNL